MKVCALLALGLAAACTESPQLLPPPFGPDGRTNARLFWPTGLAVLPGGQLLVANGNFGHQYSGGTVVTISKPYIDHFFQRGLRCDVPDPAPVGCNDADNQIDFVDAVIIGSYAGPLALSADATHAYTASRDTGVLNGVDVSPDGHLSCAPGTGQSPDCRNGVLPLLPQNLDGPYDIVPGNLLLPGNPNPQPVYFVDSIVPHLDAITSDFLETSNYVVALNANDPSQIIFNLQVASAYVGNGDAVGPMVFDETRRQLIMGGCYQTFGGTGAGEPGSSKCLLPGFNYLRIVNVDAQAQAQVQLIDMYPDVQSTDTAALLLGDENPSTGLRTLWATMRTPDTLVQIDLPRDPSVAPRVRRIVSLPSEPAEILRIQRPGAADLLAVAGEQNGAMAVYDTGTQEVVAQVERLGDTPFTLRQVPCPASPGPGAASACIVSTVFGDCKLDFIEVPLSHPWDAAVRGRAGSCPP